MNFSISAKFTGHILSFCPEPTFVSMTQMPESEMSAEGDDDKVYLFFSETAVEYDCYNKLVVSRVARVCKVKEFLAYMFIFVAVIKTNIMLNQNFLMFIHSFCLVFMFINFALWCLSVLQGRSRRSKDLAKEMDILPEGPNRLSSSWISAALHYSGHLPLVWLPAELEGLFVLRCLHTTVVRWN